MRGWQTQTADREALIRRLALASMVGQVAWVAIVAIAGLLEPGYSEIRDGFPFPADCRWSIDANCHASTAMTAGDGRTSWRSGRDFSGW
jgi:hypothetical protein